MYAPKLPDSKIVFFKCFFLTASPMLGLSFSLLCRGWTDGKLGRTPLGGSETEATTGWTDGKSWEIALGEEATY